MCDETLASDAFDHHGEKIACGCVANTAATAE